MTATSKGTNQSGLESQPEAGMESSRDAINVHYDTRLPALPWWKRIQIPIIAAIVYLTLRILGPTWRFEVLGWHFAEEIHASRRRYILPFWHRVILPATWWWRHRGIVVLNTTAFDGRWTRKVIEWFGFGTAQGSTTRGGLRGLAVMAKRLEEGRDVAFTIDGPRGPRYVAKPGPVMLARRTGCPVVPFHIGVERGKTFQRTWDHFLLPRLFTRAVLVIGKPITVAEDANRDELEGKHSEMQKELERLRDIAENWFSLSEAERDRYRAEFGK